MSGKGDLPASQFLMTSLCFSSLFCGIFYFSTELLQFFIEILTVWLTDAHRKDMHNFLSCVFCKEYSPAAMLFLVLVLQLRLCRICSMLNCLIKIYTKFNNLGSSA